MKIQTFKNRKGLIYGKDPKRIGCEVAGVLKIGKAEVTIMAECDVPMPMLFHGATGSYASTFTDKEGGVYDLGRVEVRGGLIVTPSPIMVEIMELRCRLDAAEEETIALRTKICELESAYDTDSLNFLIR